jgi:hypothetical protein
MPSPERCLHSRCIRTRITLLARFVLLAATPHERVSRIEGPITGVFVHYVKLASAADVDGQVDAWMRKAARYGRQEHRASRR